MDLNLSGKHAIVCGSTQGIGKASAMALAELGANVTLIARNEEALEVVCDELPNQNQNHRFLQADFDSPKELKERVDWMASQTKAHILVNISGGPPGG